MKRNSATANLLNSDLNGDITCGELLCSGCAPFPSKITVARIAVFGNAVFSKLLLLCSLQALQLFDGLPG